MLNFDIGNGYSCRFKRTVYGIGIGIGGEIGAVESYKLHHTLRGEKSQRRKRQSLLCWIRGSQSLNE